MRKLVALPSLKEKPQNSHSLVLRRSALTLFPPSPAPLPHASVSCLLLHPCILRRKHAGVLPVVPPSTPSQSPSVGRGGRGGNREGRRGEKATSLPSPSAPLAHYLQPAPCVLRLARWPTLQKKSKTKKYQTKQKNTKQTINKHATQCLNQQAKQTQPI